MIGRERTRERENHEIIEMGRRSKSCFDLGIACPALFASLSLLSHTLSLWFAVCDCVCLMPPLFQSQLKFDWSGLWSWPLVLSLASTFFLLVFGFFFYVHTKLFCDELFSLLSLLQSWGVLSLLHFMYRQEACRDSRDVLKHE